MRLGPGDWYLPDEHGGPREEGRALFLSSIEILVPEVIETLRDAVLPRFAAGEYRSQLQTWAAEWHLTDTWAVQFVEEVLGVWERYWPKDEPILAEWPILPAGGGWGFRPGGGGWSLNLREGKWKFRPDTPVLPHWEPTLESRAAYRLRADQLLTVYLDRVEKELVEAGFVRVPAKRSRKGADPALHFDWLVRFQVNGERLRDIASLPGGTERYVDPRTVQVAIRTTAAAIGLTRRTNPTDD